MAAQRRVVIGEDDVLLREGVARVLAVAGFEVVAPAGEADDLLRKGRAPQPDLLVSDINMPPGHGGDGLVAALVCDLHDGAQQGLVHSVITLELAQRALDRDDGDAPPLMAEALEHVHQANQELRELAHGILPADLVQGGLRGGVDAVVERLDLDVTVGLPPERFPAEIEASAYFVVAEALTNIVKHAHAESAAVTASVHDGTLELEVRDDGIGGADSDGRGLVRLNDRATALGGRLSVRSPAGAGTVLSAALPISQGAADTAYPPRPTPSFAAAAN
jgi:signal transduction histidine kinase